MHSSRKAKTICCSFFQVYGKLAIEPLLANTVFHALDHYAQEKYVLKASNIVTELEVNMGRNRVCFGQPNFDFLQYQKLKYTKNKIWRKVYVELNNIDPELANAVDMFMTL